MAAEESAQEGVQQKELCVHSAWQVGTPECLNEGVSKGQSHLKPMITWSQEHNPVLQMRGFQAQRG